MNALLLLGQDGGSMLLLAETALLLILSAVSLLKISMTKRDVEQVVKTVKDYLEVVMEEEKEADFSTAVGEKTSESREKLVKSSKEEEQTRLISAVLQEIFP